MVQDANGSNNFARYFGLFELLHVGWIADDNWCLGCVFSASNSGDFTVLEEDFVNILIEHVGSSVDSAKS